VLSACHFPATLGAVSTCLDAFLHAADLFAIRCASFTDFGADFAKTMLKMRATELKIGRCLADFGAIDHETKSLKNPGMTLTAKLGAVGSVTHRFQEDLPVDFLTAYIIDAFCQHAWML